MSNIPQRNEWIISSVKDALTDKDYLLKTTIMRLLNMTTKMFKYNNLPDTIPVKDLELLLQVGGYAIFKEVDGKLYAFTGGLGGVPNPYYLPTIAIVNNPALSFNASMKIDEECVVMLNDHLYQSLMPILNKYGSLLVEAEISLKYAILNSRIPALIQADNDNAYETATKFIEKIVRGEEYGIISSNGFFDGIRTADFAKSTQRITEIIEGVQYVKGSLFNEIGLAASFNMKREAINEAEASMNDDILQPLIDVMLECRRIGLEKVNRMYNKNITVELDSVWAKNKHQEELTIEKQEAEIDDMGGDDIEGD